jgi:hypothetical protein
MASIAGLALFFLALIAVFLAFPVSTVRSVRSQRLVTLTGYDVVKSWWIGFRVARMGADDGGKVVELRRAQLNLSPHDPELVRAYVDAVIAHPGAKWDSGVVATLKRWVMTEEATPEDFNRLMRMHQIGLITEEWVEVAEIIRSQSAQMSEDSRNLFLWMEADSWNWSEVQKRVGELESAGGVGRLVRTAWAAGHGRDPEAVRARGELEKAAKLGDAFSPIANQLLVQVGVMTTNLPLAQEAFSRLSAGGMIPRRVDQFRLARVKWRSGAVKDLATLRSGLPEVERADELEERVLLLREMGQGERAMSELEEGVVRFQRRDWWIRIAEQALRARNWKGLDRLGRRLENGGPGVGDWRVFGSGLRWIASTELGEVDTAEIAFNRGAILPVPSDRWAYEWASMLSRQDRLSVALPWLMKAEGVLSDSVPYWRLRMRLADQQTDPGQALVAIRNLRRLEPSDDALRLAEAEAMVVSDESPEKILGLLDELPVQTRGQHRAMACRALALAESGSPEEMLRTVARLEALTGTDAERAMLSLVQFEIHRIGGRVQQAAAAYQATNRQLLGRFFAAWMEKSRHVMGRGSAGKKQEPGG